MAPQIEVPERPVLVTVPNVELVQVGRWDISTGQLNVTSDDLYAAVAALDCPAVRNPVLKLGHNDPRFDGEPAVGWIGNMSVTSDGTTLVGDYRGVPAWLADVLASAYPDRSFEGWSQGYRCQIGHVHPFVVTAVALLGVTAPGIGTLESLQDVAALYGVAAAETRSGATDPDDVPFLIRSKGRAMPAPLATKVAAAATVEDVRRAFYDGPAANNWWWIEDMFVDPPEVIAVDDDSGELWRVPFDASGDAVVFADAQLVKREYVAASAAARRPLAQWASAAESRPSPRRAPAGTRSSASAEGEREEAPVSDLLKNLRTRLGLPEDADEAAIEAALAAAWPEETDADGDGDGEDGDGEGETSPPATASPSVSAAAASGVVTVDAATLADLRAKAERGDRARTEQESREREGLVAAAVSDGRIPPARRDHWLRALEVDPVGNGAALASLAPGLIPVSPIGHGREGAAESAAAAADDIRNSPVYKNWSM